MITQNLMLQHTLYRVWNIPSQETVGDDGPLNASGAGIWPGLGPLLVFSCELYSM